MPTKRQLIGCALDEIGLGPNAYAPTAQDYQTALFRLNSLMAHYAGSEAAAGWPLGDDLDAETGLPFDYQRGVVCALAVDMAPSVGRAPSPQTLTAAQQGRNLMLRKTVTPPLKRIDTTAVPAGQGHKFRFRNNLVAPDTVVTPDERLTE
jgi:hypothetical protein